MRVKLIVNRGESTKGLEREKLKIIPRSTSTLCLLTSDGLKRGNREVRSEHLG